MLMTGNCLSNRILQLLDEVWKTTGHVSVIPITCALNWNIVVSVRYIPFRITADTINSLPWHYMI